MSPGQGFDQVFRTLQYIQERIYEQKTNNKKWQKCQGNGQKGINLRIMCQKTNKKTKTRAFQN